jgi:hypothetical protein
VEVGESARIEVVGETDATADDLCAQERPRAATKANEAASMLRELLKDGQWHPYTEIAQAANNAQISLKTLKRAKQAAGVESKQFADGWYWRLVGQGATPGTVALWPSAPLPGASRSPPDNNNQYLEESEGHRTRGPRTPPTAPLPLDTDLATLPTSNLDGSK